MLRIGSGVSSTELSAINQLNKTLSQLSTTTTRLSTLKRINRASDDPAGLIALESLRSELVSLEKASQSASRARAVVQVADSSLSQASELINRVRGNVVSAANSIISDTERNALQLETDAALEALDRLGFSTSFAGRNLLDGSADFRISGVNSEQIADIQVFQRGGGSTTSVDIEVVSAATTAEFVLTDSDLADETTLVVTGTEGTVSLEFSTGASVDNIAAAVNTSSGETGVTAEVVDGEVILSSAEVGSAATVNVEVVEGSLNVGAGSAAGADVVVNVNGTEVVGEGNEVQVRGGSFEADIIIAEDFSGQADTITVSGDALTVLVGPNLSNLATLTFTKINSASLGGAAGRLSDLRSGGSADLSSGNLSRTIDILDAASNQVVTARARAGAFEKFTLDSAQTVLDDTIVNISSAISQIGDADLAAESASLVRGLILAEAGVSALRLATQNRSLIGSLLDF